MESLKLETLLPDDAGYAEAGSGSISNGPTTQKRKRN
jgi:hypothetical protein